MIQVHKLQVQVQDQVQIIQVHQIVINGLELAFQAREGVGI
jgi:hypothetical protein